MTSIASVATKNVHNVGTHKSVGRSCLALKKRYFPEGTEAAFNEWCDQQLQAFERWSETHPSSTLNPETLDSLKQFVSSKCLAPLEPFDKFTIDNTTYVIPFKQVLALVFAAASDTNTLLTQGPNHSHDAETTQQDEQRERLRCALNTAKNEGLCGDGYRQTLLLTLQGIHPDINIITDIPLVTGRLIFEYYSEQFEQHPHFFTLLQDALRLQSAYFLEAKPSAELTDFVTQHQNNCIEHIHTFFKNCGILPSDQDSLRPDMLRAQLTPEGIALHDDKRNLPYSQLLALFQYQPTQDRARPVSDYVFARMTECKNFADFNASPWRCYPVVRCALYLIDKVPRVSISEDPNHTELAAHCQALVDIRNTWNDPVFQPDSLVEALPAITSTAARFLTAYHAFRRANHLDFVTNVFVRYFALPTVEARSRLLSDLLQFNIPMFTDCELLHLFAPQENNEVFLEPETIDRFLLQAFLRAPSQWSDRYQTLLRTLIDWIDQPQNHTDWKTTATLANYQPLLKIIRVFLTLADVTHEPQSNTLDLQPAEYFPPLWLPQTNNLTVWSQFLSRIAINDLADYLCLLPDSYIDSLLRHPPLKQPLLQCDEWLITLSRHNRIDLLHVFLAFYSSLNDNQRTLKTALASDQHYLFYHIIRIGNTALVNLFVDLYKSLNDNNEYLERAFERALFSVIYRENGSVEKAAQIFGLYEKLNDDKRALKRALTANYALRQIMKIGNAALVKLFVDMYKSFNDNNESLKQAVHTALISALRSHESEVESIERLLNLYATLDNNHETLRADLTANHHRLLRWVMTRDYKTDLFPRLVDTYKRFNDDHASLKEALQLELHSSTTVLEVWSDEFKRVYRLLDGYKALNDDHETIRADLKANHHRLLLLTIRHGQSALFTRLVDVYKNPNDPNNTLLRRALQFCLSPVDSSLRTILMGNDTQTLRALFIACHAANCTDQAWEALLKQSPMFSSTPAEARSMQLLAAEVIYRQTHRATTVCIPANKAAEPASVETDTTIPLWAQMAANCWERLEHWFLYTLLGRHPNPNPPPLMAHKILKKYAPVSHPYIRYESLFQKTQQLLAHFVLRREELRSTSEISSPEKALLYDTLIRTLSAHRDAAGQRYARECPIAATPPLIDSLPFSDSYRVRRSRVLGSLSRSRLATPPATTTMADHMAHVGIFSTQTLRDVRSAIALDREFARICYEENASFARLPEPTHNGITPGASV